MAFKIHKEDDECPEEKSILITNMHNPDVSVPNVSLTISYRSFRPAGKRWRIQHSLLDDKENSVMGSSHTEDLETAMKHALDFCRFYALSMEVCFFRIELVGEALYYDESVIHKIHNYMEALLGEKGVTTEDDT